MNSKLLVIIALFSVVLLYNCSDPDPAQETFEEMMIGEWILYEYERLNCPDEGYGEDIPLTRGDDQGCLQIDGGNFCFAFDIRANGVLIHSYSEQGYSDIDTLSYTIDQNLSLLNFCYPTSQCFEYPIIDNQIILSEENELGCKWTVIMEKKK